MLKPGDYCGGDVPLEAISVLQCVLKRPGMYTSQGAFEQILILIDGYALGIEALRLHDPKLAALQQKIDEYSVLFEWMRNIARPKGNYDKHSCYYMLEELRQKFSSTGIFCEEASKVIEEWAKSGDKYVE